MQSDYTGSSRHRHGGQAVTKGGDALGRVQGGSRAVAPSPRSPTAVTRCPAPAHPGLGPPRDRQLTNYGQGHLKTWPLQHRGCKGKRRQVGGHRDALRPLDGNRRSWLRRGTGLRASGHPGARAHRARRLHRTQCLRAEEAGGKKKKKEEKLCLLSCWCCPPTPCEEGKEGHGQPGRREPPAERRGRARWGLRKGGGRLPSPPAPAIAAFPPPPGQESAAAASACSKQQQHHPLKTHMEEGPGP